MKLKIHNLEFIFFLFSFLFLTAPAAYCIETYVFDRLWPTLEQPWFFTRPMGIAVDRSGVVFISDELRCCIKKFNRDGKFITQWGTKGTVDGQFNAPYGIALDSDGYVYVADRGNHRIQRFTPDGTPLAWQATDDIVHAGFSFPSGVAVDASGNIYVSDTGNNCIRKFSASGQFLHAWGSSAQFKDPRGIAVDASENIYVADSLNHRIQKFTDNGTFILKWGKNGGDGTLGMGNGEFYNPEYIAVDASGSIYVTDYGNNRVQRFTPEGVFLGKWGANGGDGTSGSADGEFYRPEGIAFDPAGYIYVADYSNNRIQKFYNNDLFSFAASWSAAGNSPGMFRQPAGMAPDEEGNFYVADFKNNRIQKLSDNGTFKLQWGSTGTAVGQFNYPFSIARGPGPLHLIYVADRDNHRIQRFTRDGTPLPWQATDDIASAGFKAPYGVATDAIGCIYVADTNNNRIVKFSDNGTLIKTWNGAGTAGGPLSKPRGITVARDGFVYVADQDNHRIQKFSDNGSYILKWGKNGGDGSSDNGSGEFHRPSGVAADDEGNIYVADSGNNRIQKFTGIGDFITAWGSYGTNPGQMIYPAGLFVNIDGRVFVADQDNHRIQVFKKTETLENSRAIIVAGGGPYTGNNLWDATEVCANFACRTLLGRGFPKDRICYLTPDTGLDLDGNNIFDAEGKSDDIAGPATNENLQAAVTSWAADADSLVLYLIDHGGSSSFRMSETQTLAAASLASWLNAVTATSIVVYEACDSGSFVNELKADNRIVVTSTSSGEKAKLIAKGTLSFSNFFWSNILNSLSIRQAYEGARDAISFTFDNQHPLLDNGTISASQLYIGAGTQQTAGQAPSISSVSAVLSGESSALISAEIALASEGISRVWALVFPPGYGGGATDRAVIAVPAVDLSPAAAGSSDYTALFSGLTTGGTYSIAVYATDKYGRTSSPAFASLTVSNPLKRKAVIMVSGSETDPSWPAVQSSASLSYKALSAHGYAADDIIFMSPVTFSSGIDYGPSLSNLEFALTDWGEQDTYDMVLFMIGAGSARGFQISDPELLTPVVLDAWLDSLQENIPGAVTVILDADCSGAFVPELIPPADKNRIVIAGSCPTEPMLYSKDGNISFSRLFWNQIESGASVYRAFAFARNSISFLNSPDAPFACYTHTPVIDDNGNGIANELADGNFADDFIIGMDILFADDPPMIGSAGVDDAAVSGQTSTIIWAKDITSTCPLLRVWAVITPPSFCPAGVSSLSSDLPRVDLVYNSVAQRYEASYDIYYTITPGTASVTVYAMNEYGTVSLPAAGAFYQTAAPDAYEEDDNFDQARPITINDNAPQLHNFDSQGDHDWIKFYVNIPEGEDSAAYNITADNLGADCHPVIDLYDDNQTWIARRYAISDNNTVSLDWSFTQSGMYHVLVTPFSGEFGDNMQYSLRVTTIELPFFGLIAGTVRDETTGALVANCRITTNGGGSAVTSNGEYEIVHPAGTFTLTAAADGYLPSGNISVTVEEGGIVAKDILLTPINTASSTTTISGGGHGSPSPVSGPILYIQAFLDMGLTIEKTSFQIKNIFSGTLTWQIGEPVYHEGSGWITAIEPSSGTATFYQPGAVWVSVSRQNLPSGIYIAELPVTSNGGSDVIVVGMEVSPSGPGSTTSTAPASSTTTTGISPPPETTTTTTAGPCLFERMFAGEQASKPEGWKDRVESRGLRPVTLPHHRTCGFPHPAIRYIGLAENL